MEHFEMFRKIPSGPSHVTNRCSTGAKDNMQENLFIYQTSAKINILVIRRTKKVEFVKKGKVRHLEEPMKQRKKDQRMSREL